MSARFPIEDTVGAWVPHGRFVIEPASTGPLTSLTFAVKDVFDVAAHATGAGNPNTRRRRRRLNRPGLVEAGWVKSNRCGDLTVSGHLREAAIGPKRRLENCSFRRQSGITGV